MDGDTIEQLRSDLLQAQLILSNLNLFQASKWCAEAVNGLPKPTKSVSIPTQSMDQVDIQDYSTFILAKSYFNVKEFDRCSYCLKDCKSGNAIFLKLYSKLLSIDKKLTEETDGSVNLINLQDNPGDKSLKNGSNDPKILQRASGSDSTSKLGKIIHEIEAYNTNSAPNSFLYYLLGVVYNKKRNHKHAQQSLIQSLKLFPYNWSAWQELVQSLSDLDEATALIDNIKSSKTTLNSTVTFKFFELMVIQEFFQPHSNVDHILEYLFKIFPSFNFLKLQKFLLCYHSLDYYQAELIFDQILEDDPLRLDDLDTYSNMLYVMKKEAKLSFLAQYSSNIDKFRPETCCIIANHHSMKGEHEKAIMYYKRALTLNKGSLSAWTLMGHEFMELKNSHAAIESYRRAVDINPRDFRAWYGLGQAYEFLDMHMYSLYYFQRATHLQPLDKRMWQAIGNCYEKIKKFPEAIKSFEKALTIDTLNKGEEGKNEGSYDPSICYKLATIYERINKSKDCWKYMKLCYDQELDWGITDDTSKARLWLARHALSLKKYDEAYELTKDLNHNNAHDIEEARAIAREARNRMNK